ncbi:hypothetical protein UW593_10760, partial [Streptococcus agalactiae]
IFTYITLLKINRLSKGYHFLVFGAYVVEKQRFIFLRFSSFFFVSLIKGEMMYNTNHIPIQTNKLQNYKANEFHEFKSKITL